MKIFSIFTLLKIAGLRHGGFKKYCRLKWRIVVCKQLHVVSNNALFGAFSFMQKPFELLGQKFGKLTIKEILPVEKGQKHRYCIVECECGNIKEVQIDSLKRGLVRSCGCMYNSRRTKHGLSKSRLDRIYDCMIGRCYRNYTRGYKNYGGRGISVCDEWRNDKTKFFGWALQNGYAEGLQLDRRNNNGNYEPSNCRWVTCKVNANNTRKNTLFTFNGVTKTANEWAEGGQVCGRIVYMRLRAGWSLEKALSTPVAPSSIQITYKDKTQSKRDWAKEYGIGEGTLNFRLRKGWSIEDALNTPLLK